MRYQVRQKGESHFKHVLWDTVRDDLVLLPGSGHYIDDDWLTRNAADRLVAIYNRAYGIAMRLKHEPIRARELA